MLSTPWRMWYSNNKLATLKVYLDYYCFRKSFLKEKASDDAVYGKTLTEFLIKLGKLNGCKNLAWLVNSHPS